MKYLEANEQVKVVQYLRLQYPQILFSGGFAGERLGKLAAIRRKRAGYTAGTPDIIIFEPRNGAHGLMVEMKKAGGGILSDKQKYFLQKAESRGYAFSVCAGFMEAKKAIDDYLGRPQ